MCNCGPIYRQNQYADNGRERQKGHKTPGPWCVSPRPASHVKCSLFIRMALPEKLRNRHTDNGGDGNRQRGFERKID